jgi:putative hydrolase of the HAD superfamily
LGPSVVIRAVLFDLDDTLLDRRLAIEAYTVCFVRAFGERLATKDVANIMAELRIADRDGYNPDRSTEVAHLGIWRSAPAASEVAQHWAEHFSACAVPRSAVQETLTELRNSRFRLGVVSNGSSAAQRTKLAVTGLDQAFDLIVISDEVGLKKPDPRIFALATTSLGVSPSECLFVGDNPIKDVCAARDFGMRAAWLRASLPWPERVPSAEHELDSLAELGRLIRTMKAR